MKNITVVGITVAVFAAATLIVVASNPKPTEIVGPKIEVLEKVSLKLYECGDGDISTVPCDEREISPIILGGYDKTFRCNNGWQVTHPDYCPDSGKNNIYLLKG